MLPRVAFQAVQAVNSMTDDKLEAARDEGDHQLSNSRNIISRDEAKALDLKRFFTGKPCKRGHIAERSVHSGRCLECGRARSAKWKAANQKRVREAAWRAENKEKIAAYERQWYAKNRDKILSKRAAWRAANKSRRSPTA
jgi:hypothetical protein